jgi:uncharacterized phage protein (TIGR02218 family)
MVKSLDPEFKKALIQPNLTFAWCWLITRRDGLMLGFTSIDLELAIDDVVYRPFTGFDPGAAQLSEGLDKTDSQTLAGILDQSGISREDLLSGVYQGAQVKRFLVNYLDLPGSFDDSPTQPTKFLELPRGYIAEVKSNNLGYEIKVKDNLSLLDRPIGTNSSMTCRCNLGDDRCRVNLAPFTHQVTVSEVTSRRNFKISGQFKENYFDRGRLKFTTGNNAEIHRDIGFYVNNSLILYEPLPFDVAVGDALTVIAGCVKTELACVVKFRNFANFQGEPDIPTTDLAINTPSG